MAATLPITADPADVRRALGAVVSEGRAANRALAADSRRAAAERRKLEQDEVRQARRDLASLQRERVRATNERLRVEREAEARIARARREAARDERATRRERLRDAAKDARELDRIARRELADRLRNERRAVVEQRALARAGASEFIRAENEKTRAAERGVDARGRLRERALGAAAGFAVGVGRRGLRAAGAAASDFMGQVAAVRQTAGARERMVNGALFQAGITGQGAAAAQGRVRGFLASGEGRGIDGDELAVALNRAQTETNVLGRPGGLEDFLRNAQLARDTYQNVGEVTRVGGYLSNLGVRGGDNRAALLSLTAVAQRGGIELSDVAAEALGPLVANINNAVADATRGGRQITPGQRSDLVSRAAARGLAIAETTQGSGMGPRRTLNAFSMWETGLQNEDRVNKLRNAMRLRMGDRDFAARDAELFEGYRDAHGTRRYRMKNTNGLQMGRRLLEVFGNDSTALVNALSPGGRGAPQAFTHPVREMLRTLSGTDESGKTGFERADELSRATISEERVREGHEMGQGETQTQLTAQNEEHIRAIMANTEALDLQNRIAALRAADPILAASIRAAGGEGAEIAAAFGGAGQRGARQLSYGEMSEARDAALTAAAGGRAAGTWRALTSGQSGPYDPARDADPAFRQRYQAALASEVQRRGGAAPGATSLSREAVADLVRAIERIRLTVASDPLRQAQDSTPTGVHAAPPEARGR